jgi:alpha-mannosidase
LPDAIETKHYSAHIDSSTGAIISLKLKPSGREVFAAPANVIVAERPLHMKAHDDPGDFMPPRSERARLGTSSDAPSKIAVRKGPLATTVEISSTFYGGNAIRRVLRFYEDHPRVDFETELNDIPNFTVVVSEFPLAEEVPEIRRGIPYGFSHGAWSTPNPSLPGWTRGIVPAVRWIDYSLTGGGGFAIFDRGCSGREIDGKTPIIYLLNAEDKYNGYPNSWLSGKGKHTLQYAMVAHEADWPSARIPQMAWEYNQPPTLIPRVSATAPKSYLETSPNVVVEAVRREGDHIELRLVECLGQSGIATVRCHLPHSRFALTDFMGRHKADRAGSSDYEFPVKAQEIVTIHLKTAQDVGTAQSITSWDKFVPAQKLPALHAYDANLVGHPPFGT